MFIYDIILSDTLHQEYDEDGRLYTLVSWSAMDAMHRDETVRRISYVGNKILEDSLIYACFNVIPKSSSEVNAHVAVKI